MRFHISRVLYDRIRVARGLNSSGGGYPEPTWSPGERDLLAWWDPSDLTTMFQDTDATSPVTAHGQSVARINDKSGNGYHWVQPTSGERPIYQAGGGFHWLLFDGSDDILGVSMTPPQDKLSYFIGVEPAAGDDLWMIAHDPADTGGAFFGVVQAGSGSSASGTLDAYPEYRVNGVDIPSATRNDLAAALPPSSPGVASVIGAGIWGWSSFTFGRYAPAAVFNFSGKFFGSILCPDQTTENRDLIEAWLSAKSGVA